MSSVPVFGSSRWPSIYWGVEGAAGWAGVVGVSLLFPLLSPLSAGVTGCGVSGFGSGLGSGLGVGAGVGFGCGAGT